MSHTYSVGFCLITKSRGRKQTNTRYQVVMDVLWGGGDKYKHAHSATPNQIQSQLCGWLGTIVEDKTNTCPRD